MQKSTLTAPTRMRQEAAAAKDAVSRQTEQSATALDELADRLQHRPPAFVATCARGSSDHAATFAKYLIESRLGWITASWAPSISSRYLADTSARNALFLAISQSGASPDLVQTAAAAQKQGALVVALINTTDSPLAELADLVIPLNAGVETSVAATKSYIATLSALIHMVARISGDSELLNALDALPHHLDKAWQLDWSAMTEELAEARNLFVIGRGVGLGIAQEAALKLKETCNLHAEAFSAAEVKHGPMAIVDRDFPCLVFSQRDETEESIDEVAALFQSRGARILYAGANANENIRLPVLPGLHPVVAPVAAIQSFYGATEALSRRRGYNPDEPPSLKKVTQTL